MRYLKQHVSIKVAALLLVLALITPSIVKFTHVFNHHKHEVCLGELQTHLHELNTDCNFYKFKISKPFSFTAYQYHLQTEKINHDLNESQFEFISDFQRLQNNLRGPPPINLT